MDCPHSKGWSRGEAKRNLSDAVYDMPKSTVLVGSGLRYREEQSGIITGDSNSTHSLTSINTFRETVD
jgi:hypothetical protein